MVDLIRRAATAGLVLFALITGVVALFPWVYPPDFPPSGESRPADGATPTSLPTGRDTSKPSITLYYFHGNNFCRNCQAMRDFIDATLTERFGPERADGKLLLRT